MFRTRSAAPLVLVLALVSACAQRAAEPPAAVVVAPDPADDGTIPPPRPVPLAAEPSDAKDALEVRVTGGASARWRVQYPQGQRVVLGEVHEMTAAERAVYGYLVLPLDRPVRFVVAAEGDAAPFEILRFAVSVEAAKGREVHATVKPTRAGEFAVRSARGRIGTAVVVPAIEFDAWLQGQRPWVEGKPPTNEGRQLFLKFQCNRCHRADPTAKGPGLEGLYGTKVALKGGGVELADDQYIIESIRRPRVKVVEGWEPIMPAYDETQISAEELTALVAYIRGLKKGGAKNEESFPPPIGAPSEPPKGKGGPPADDPSIPHPRLEPLRKPVAPPPREKPQ